MGEAGSALMRTFFARGVAALGALGLVIIIGNLYGANGVGVFALAQSILLGAAIFSRQGMDGALIRFIGRDSKSPQVKSYLIWAGWRSLTISLPMLVLVIFSRAYFEDFFSIPGLSGVLTGIALAIPFYTWSFLLASFFKGIHKPATSAMQENGAIAVVAALLIVLFHLTGMKGGGLDLLGWVYFFSAALIAFKGSLLAYIYFSGQEECDACELEEENISEFRSSSLSFFIMGVSRFMQTVLSIMIAGKLLGSVELGLFKAAQQIAVSIAFVLLVINAVYPPRFASLYYKGDIWSLGKLARQAALLGLALSAPFLILCLLVPEFILGFLGQEFESAAPLLRIMALAQLVNVATGSVGYLMNMTGHDKLMRGVALLCNGLGLAGFIFFIPWLGGFGAALALAFVMVAQNLVALILVWIKLGIWTMPGPNWLALLGVRSQQEHD